MVVRGGLWWCGQTVGAVDGIPVGGGVEAAVRKLLAASANELLEREPSAALLKAQYDGRGSGGERDNGGRSRYDSLALSWRTYDEAVEPDDRFELPVVSFVVLEQGKKHRPVCLLFERDISCCELIPDRI